MGDVGGDLDRFDHDILEAVATDGRISITDLAERIGLSKTPTQLRLKKLRADGYITGFRAILDPAKLGRDHVAFVEVTLTDTTEHALQAFSTASRRVRAVEQCHMIAGAFDYLLKVRTRSMAEYRRVLGEEISALPHVGKTSTHVVMEAIKDTVS